jgi:hypothetical protein
MHLTVRIVKDAPKRATSGDQRFDGNIDFKIRSLMENRVVMFRPH